MSINLPIANKTMPSHHQYSHNTLSLHVGSFVVDPALNRQFKSDMQIKCSSCWADGTAVLMRDGRLLCCGLAAATACRIPPMDFVERAGYGGRLHRLCELFREPRALRTLGVRMVACGANHCVCVTDQLGAMSWGDGAGGKLGHGNTEDVKEPKRIKAMMNDIVLYVACGAWHSLAVVLIPPLYGDGVDHDLGLRNERSTRLGQRMYGTFTQDCETLPEKEGPHYGEVGCCGQEP